jgi:hypothetical protein
LDDARKHEGCERLRGEDVQLLAVVFVELPPHGEVANVCGDHEAEAAEDESQGPSSILEVQRSQRRAQIDQQARGGQELFTRLDPCVIG